MLMWPSWLSYSQRPRLWHALAKSHRIERQLPRDPWPKGRHPSRVVGQMVEARWGAQAGMVVAAGQCTVRRLDLDPSLQPHPRAGPVADPRSGAVGPARLGAGAWWRRVSQQVTKLER